MSAAEEQLSLGGTDADLERAAAYRRAMISAARRSGEAASIAAEDSDWVDCVFEYIERLPVGAETNADRIRALFGPSLAVGGILARAQRAGLIRSTGFAVSVSPSRHGGVLRTWERLP